MSINQNQPKFRVESLDYFRGLVALSIVAYHMLLFTYGDVDSATLLGKFNTYRVSFFYIISGITLYLVYADRLYPNKVDLSVFYIKRFFRLVPLLWLATILTVVLQFSPEMVSLKKIIANITVLPGAFKPETFIASGAWSIGDELFFYLFFPLVIFLARVHKIYLFISLLISFLFLCYFAFFILDPMTTLGAQWSKYVNPFGQIFFFISGLTLGFLGKYVPKQNIIACILFVIVFVLFSMHPVSGDSIVLITGKNRLILSFYAIVLCFLFYKFDFSFLPGVFKTILQFLGNISYSLYLLHPIVYFLVKDILKLVHVNSGNMQIAFTVILSIILASISYRFFEQYFIRLGKRVYTNVVFKMQQRKLEI